MVIKLRRLNERNVKQKVKQVLKEDAYKEAFEKLDFENGSSWSVGGVYIQGGGGQDHEMENYVKVPDLYQLVWDKLYNETSRIMEETEQDFRVSVGRAWSFTVNCIVLPTLIVLIVFDNGETHSPFVFLGICLPLLTVVFFVQRRYLEGGKFFSDDVDNFFRTSGSFFRFLRGRRVVNDRFEFLVRTRLSEEINKELSRRKIQLLPRMIRGANLDVISPIGAIEDIRDRVRSRKTGAIGISGSRGAGKTVVLNDLQRFEPEIGQMVWLRLPSPNTEADLARYVLGAISDKLSKEKYPTKYRRRQKLGLLLSWILLFVLIAGVSFIVIVVALSGLPDGVTRPAGETLKLAHDEFLNLPLSLYFYLVFLGFFLLPVIMFVRVFHLYRGMGYVAALAEDIRSRLLFEENLIGERSLGAGLGGVNVGWGRTRSRREREMGVGDVYRTFEQLATCYRKASGKRIVLLIDELDRYEESGEGARQLMRALNQVKPFFMVPGVSAVMTVSDQARRSFENKDKESLSVLDSTFDEMVPVPPWNVDELKTLLVYWVVGMPTSDQERLAELSGGRPREVMRLARIYCDIMNNKMPLELWSEENQKDYEAARSEVEKGIYERGLNLLAQRQGEETWSSRDA